MIKDLRNIFSFFKNLKYFLDKIVIIILFVYIICIHLILFNKNNISKIDSVYEKRLENYSWERMINFDYLNYNRNFVTEKMKENAAWQLSEKQVYFMNGLIRKLKPKSCLEIGVANGGSSILILNALKDIKDSSLVSLDISEKSCTDPGLKTGHRVKTYFPELAKKWSLYTGDLPNKFLVKLNKKFDFAFIDSAHESPGEILNLIEILPFLNENAIIVLHDIFWHFTRRAPKPPREVKFTPSNIYLLSALYGEKLLINNELENMGAVFLYKNQKKHYLDYFLLLNGFWEYMPTQSQIQDLRLFIKKYYNNDLFLRLFDNTVTFNKIYINKFKMFVDNCTK